MFSGIGLPEILIVLVIALVVLGPKRLPEAGRSLGRGLREFKDSIAGDGKDDDRDEIESYTTPTASSTPKPAATAEPAPAAPATPAEPTSGTGTTNPS